MSQESGVQAAVHPTHFSPFLCLHQQRSPVQISFGLYSTNCCQSMIVGVLSEDCLPRTGASACLTITSLCNRSKHWRRFLGTPYSPQISNTVRTSRHSPHCYELYESFSSRNVNHWENWNAMSMNRPTNSTAITHVATGTSFHLPATVLTKGHVIHPRASSSAIY